VRVEGGKHLGTRDSGILLFIFYVYEIPSKGRERCPDTAGMPMRSDWMDTIQYIGRF